MNCYSCPQLMVPPVILLFSSFLPQGQQRLACDAEAATSTVEYKPKSLLAVEGSVLMDALAIALLLAGGLDCTARAPSKRCATGAAPRAAVDGGGALLTAVARSRGKHSQPMLERKPINGGLDPASPDQARDQN